MSGRGQGPRRVVAWAVVPMTAFLDAPPSVPYERRGEVEARLKAGGFDVFTLTHDELAPLLAVAGINGWLRERGYHPGSAEVVFFEVTDMTDGWRGRPAVIVGALRAVGGAP